MARSFNQWEKREQAIVCVVVPLLIAGAIGYFAWGELKKLGPDPALYTFMQRPGGVWQSINDINAQITVQQAVVDSGPRVEKQLAALQEKIREAESTLPRVVEKAEMTKLIEEYARQVLPEIGIVQFRAVSIKEGGVVKGEDYQPITYNTEIVGDLNGIIKFIDQIEKNQRFMMVRTLSIKPGKLEVSAETQAIKETLHEAKMEIVTFVYNPSADSSGRRAR